MHSFVCTFWHLSGSRSFFLESHYGSWSLSLRSNGFLFLHCLPSPATLCNFQLFSVNMFSVQLSGFLLLKIYVVVVVLQFLGEHLLRRLTLAVKCVLCFSCGRCVTTGSIWKTNTSCWPSRLPMAWSHTVTYLLLLCLLRSVKNYWNQ